MKGRLYGKCAIVTGAGQGVGRGIALAMGKEGAKIVIAVRNVAKGEDVLKELHAAGITAAMVKCDVAVKQDVANAVKHTVDTYGGVDILVNNAHDTRMIQAPFMEWTDDALKNQFDSGFMGAYWFMRECFEHLKVSGSGRIVNISSGAGVRGAATFLGYAASKEAQRAMTRVAAREWGDFGITCNTICPVADSPTMAEFVKHPELGWNDILPVLPIKRLGSCEHEVGRTAVFLASPDAGYITGHTINVDGGFTMDGGR
ncbi:MAG: SDR family oxidoreductase [Gammaproteobacteria bacterium]|nr:SDR family oxidoreductase [Gammaproteobacteria bacterium]